MALNPGQRFEFQYPFARATYSQMDGDEDGLTFTDVPTWKVGVRHADKGEGDVESISDGIGACVLTVISLHKPGKYPERVFFTRTWVTPEGKAFGKTKCRVTTIGAFMGLTRGYRHPFVLKGCDCKGCDWPNEDHRRGPSIEAEEAFDGDVCDGRPAARPRRWREGR